MRVSNIYGCVVFHPSTRHDASFILSRDFNFREAVSFEYVGDVIVVHEAFQVIQGNLRPVHAILLKTNRAINIKERV